MENLYREIILDHARDPRHWGILNPSDIDYEEYNPLCGDRLRITLGSVLDPHSAFLLERGIKTLGLRVQKQNETALCIANFLEEHPAIEQVWYPGLPSHPEHHIAKQQMDGFGGVVSFTVRGDLHLTSRFIDRLRIPYIAPSLGGVESLIEQPALMSYYEKTPRERRELKMHDNLVRFAVGIEDQEDIIMDLTQALETIM